VTWADLAAEAMLGASLGAQLATYASPDQIDRVQALVADGIRETVENRAVVLMVNGRPLTHTSRSLAEHERERLARDANANLPNQHLNREVALNRIREVLAKTGLATPGEEPSGV
jgi:hypothetical protein